MWFLGKHVCYDLDMVVLTANSVSLGQDLEGFARHAKRKTVNLDDVRMMCRRNSGLQQAIEQYIAQLQGSNE